MKTNFLRILTVTRTRWATMRLGVLGLLILSAGGIAVPSVAWGQSDISVTAEISSQKVDLQSSIQLMIKINGSQNTDPVELPTIDGFDVQYQGPSTQVSIVNGKYASSVAFNYILFPKATGHFQIPSFNVTVEGKTFRTNPIDLEVIANGSATAGSGQGALSLEDKIKMDIQLEADTVYVNQGVPVIVRLAVADVPLSGLDFPRFDEAGYRVSDMDQPKRTEQVINGIRYKIFEFRARIYPTRTGDLPIGPASVSANLVYRDQRSRSAGGRFGSLFDDSFFSGFFGGNQVRPITIQSASQTLHVRDVPQTGRPANYSGAVGHFQFDAQASPLNVQAGDPITVNMLIAGDGNLANVRFPEISASPNDFRVYDPSVTSDPRGRLSEQVVIPLRADVKSLPALEFVYFDPTDEKFHTIRKGPFPLTVAPSANGQEVFTGPLAPLPQVQIPVGEDIVYLKDQVGSLRMKGGAFYQRPWYVVILLLIFIFGGAGYFGIHFWQKFTEDPVLAARLRAYREARRSLKALHSLAKPEHSVAFYDGVFAVLQGYFANKWQMPVGDVCWSRLKEHERFGRLSASVQKELCDVFQVCEAVRFSGSGAKAGNPQADFLKIESLLRECERS